MPEPHLTKEQMQRLLKFKGYGNPAGRYWFIGMEEGGGSLDELLMRADQFDEVQDLDSAQRLIDPKVDRCKLVTSTWTTMCQIVGKLSGVTAWSDTDHGGFVRTYQSNRLGRCNDETFLTEILPLPKKNSKDWPYASLYASRKVYEAAVLPRRIAELRDLFDKHSPEYVFCYGKGFWPHHRSVFRDAEFTPIPDGAAQIATLGPTTITLTKFFDPSFAGVTVEFIGRLCDTVSAARASGSRP